MLQETNKFEVAVVDDVSDYITGIIISLKESIIL